MLSARLLPLVLCGLATAQESAPVSRPLVDPALVGTWGGITGYGTLRFEYEFRSGGTIKETRWEGLRVSHLYVALLRADDGKWSREGGSSGSYRSSGAYKLKRRRSLDWTDDGRGYPFRLNRVASGTTTRPATRSRVITPDELDTIPELIALSKDPEAEYRELALSHLGLIGRSRGDNASAVLPTLVAALSDPAPEVAVLAAHVIGCLGKLGTSASPSLIDSLRRPDSELRRQAAHALVKVETEADLAIPALAALIASDLDDTTALIAVESLGGFGQKSAGPLGDVLRNPFGPGVGTALRELAKLKADAVPAIPAIARFLREGDEYHREQAIDALRAIGPAARPAVPELIRVLEGEEDFAIKAAQALGDFPEDAEKSAPGMLKLLARTKDSFWTRSRSRVEIIEAIGFLGRGAAVAVPTLTKLIDDEWEAEPVRRAATWARKKIAGK